MSEATKLRNEVQYLQGSNRKWRKESAERGAPSKTKDSYLQCLRVCRIREHEPRSNEANRIEPSSQLSRRTDAGADVKRITKKRSNRGRVEDVQTKKLLFESHANRCE
jgi:hypothetical protein